MHMLYVWNMIIIQKMTIMLLDIPYMQYLANKEWTIVWQKTRNIEWGYVM